MVLGEEGVKRANEQRFTERLMAQFEQYRQQRLANSESECRKMISDITTRLTQVNAVSDLLHRGSTL